ncbi:MAG: hypothetical protein Q4E05_10845 [Pseudoclavibacter sp.]|nr:hypothetical protein [Pseudoclavibacter sp.]
MDEHRSGMSSQPVSPRPPFLPAAVTVGSLTPRTRLPAAPAERPWLRAELRRALRRPAVVLTLVSFLGQMLCFLLMWFLLGLPWNVTADHAFAAVAVFTLAGSGIYVLSMLSTVVFACIAFFTRGGRGPIEFAILLLAAAVPLFRLADLLAFPVTMLFWQIAGPLG